jgi:hypothetical protein
VTWKSIGLQNLSVNNTSSHSVADIWDGETFNQIIIGKVWSSSSRGETDSIAEEKKVGSHKQTVAVTAVAVTVPAPTHVEPLDAAPTCLCHQHLT